MSAGATERRVVAASPPPGRHPGDQGLDAGGAGGLPGAPPHADGDTDVPRPLASMLTTVGRKVEEYRRDPHFRAGVNELLARAGAGGGLSPHQQALQRRALMILKPDAVAGRRLDAALDAAASHGFRPVALRAFRFTPLLTRELWRYQFNMATAERALVVDLLLPACDSLAVLLEDEAWRPGALPGSLRLAGLKGPADPTARKPGTLRLALESPTTLLNFVHTADDPADLLREAALLSVSSGLPLLGETLHPSTLPGVAPRQRAATIGALYRQAPAHDLDAAASRERLASRHGLRRPPGVGEGAWPGWRDLLPLVRSPAATPEDLWDFLAVATAEIPSNVPGVRPIVPAPRAGDWPILDEHAGA